MAKDLVGLAARDLGLVPGAVRGVWNTGKDVGKGLFFLSRLANPLADALLSPAGDTASDQMLRAGKGLVDYTRNAISNPKMVADDVREGVRGFRATVDPAASPPADTFWGEAARNFDIGLNRGEAAFDAASLLVGGPELKALAGIGRLSKEAQIAKYIASGHPENVAKYFAEPYRKGMGHHFWPRARKLPEWMGGGRLPRVISDSPFNVLKPRNITNGEFYKLHFEVDPKYRGGKIPEEFGGGTWSGQDLGWIKRGRAGRIWYGSPPPLKAVAGAGMFGAGGIVDQIRDERGQP